MKHVRCMYVHVFRLSDVNTFIKRTHFSHISYQKLQMAANDTFTHSAFQ